MPEAPLVKELPHEGEGRRDRDGVVVPVPGDADGHQLPQQDEEGEHPVLPDRPRGRPPQSAKAMSKASAESPAADTAPRYQR